MSFDELEKLYNSLCKEKPNKKSLDSFKKYKDQQKVINFLVDKLKTYIKFEKDYIRGKHEWGIIHSVGLLGDIKAVESIESLVSIMDMVKDDYLAIIYSYTIDALSDMGEAALEPVYKMYLSDRVNPDRSSVWLSIMANLGVKDKRIYKAIREHFEIDPIYAINLMGDYGDKAFLEIVKKYLKETANALNAKKIDPFEYGARFKIPEANAYIETREVLVELETGLPLLSEELDKKVEELDNDLLNYSDKRNRQGRSEILQKIKKGEIEIKDSEYLKNLQSSLERLFSELQVTNTFGEVVAIIMAALSYPDMLSFNIIYPKIFNNKEVSFDTMEQANLFNQTIMDLWNFLVDCQSPEYFQFLKYNNNIDNYIKERCDEIGEYLEQIFLGDSSDIYQYTKDSQKEIKCVKEEWMELKKIVSDKCIVSTVDPLSIQTRVIKVWEKMFFVKTLEDENRKKKIREEAYQPKIIKKKVGRNDTCPCGSGKKYKYCCMN